MGAIGQLPGARLVPGLLWAGQAGYSSCDMDCWHWTAGYNSIGIIRDRGLCQHLTRDEGIYAFTADAGMVAYTQCEWNRRATANEVESIDGSVSEAQLALMAYREVWVVAQTGIPPVYFDAPAMGAQRMPVGTPYRGVTTHRSLVHRACDMHSDGFDVWVWERVWGGGPPPAPAPELPKEGEMRLFRNRDDDSWYLWDGYGWNEGIPGEVVWDLHVEGKVPASVVGAGTMHWLMLHVGQNVEAQIQRIAQAVDR